MIDPLSTCSQVDRVVKYRYDSVQYDDGEEMIKTELSSTFGSQVVCEFPISYPFASSRKTHFEVLFCVDGRCLGKSLNEFVVVTQLLELLKCKIMKDKPVVEVEQDDIYAQMKQAQESFMAAHSKKIRGREDILEQVSSSVYKSFRCCVPRRSFVGAPDLPSPLVAF